MHINNNNNNNNNNNFIFDIAPILTVLSALQQSMKHSKINVRLKR